MKKIQLFLIALLFISFSLRGHDCKNQNPQAISCAPALQPYLLKMLQVPEIKYFIAEIQKEGLFTIDLNNNSLSQQFGAYWDVDRRVICINLSAHQTEGEVIGSILFELQNAASNATIEAIDRSAKDKKINRQQYIESIEYMEYKNSLNAAFLAKKGIDMGIFPQDALLPTYKDFKEHFYYQQIGGHSAFIGKNYDHLLSSY